MQKEHMQRREYAKKNPPDKKDRTLIQKGSSLKVNQMRMLIKFY